MSDLIETCTIKGTIGGTMYDGGNWYNFGPYKWQPEAEAFLIACYPLRSDASALNGYTDLAIAEYNKEATSPYVLATPMSNTGDERACMMKAVAIVFGLIGNALEAQGHNLNSGSLAWIRASAYTG